MTTVKKGIGSDPTLSWFWIEAHIPMLIQTHSMGPEWHHNVAGIFLHMDIFVGWMHRMVRQVLRIPLLDRAVTLIDYIHCLIYKNIYIKKSLSSSFIWNYHSPIVRLSINLPVEKTSFSV